MEPIIMAATVWNTVAETLLKMYNVSQWGIKYSVSKLPWLY